MKSDFGSKAGIHYIVKVAPGMLLLMLFQHFHDMIAAGTYSHSAILTTDASYTPTFSMTTTTAATTTSASNFKGAIKRIAFLQAC